MPPVLRICAGAVCPRKKTDSGKSLGLMSDAFSTVSLSGFGSADCPRNSAALPAISILRKIAVLLSANSRRFIFIFPPKLLQVLAYRVHQVAYESSLCRDGLFHGSDTAGILCYRTRVYFSGRLPQCCSDARS